MAFGALAGDGVVLQGDVPLGPAGRRRGPCARGRRSSPGAHGPPERYEAIERRLVALAGGKWERIEPIIAETLLKQGIFTTVYDFD